MNTYKIIVKNTNGEWGTFIREWKGNQEDVKEFVKKLNNNTKTFVYKSELVNGVDDSNREDVEESSKPKSKKNDDDAILKMLEQGDNVDGYDENDDPIDDFASNLTYDEDDENQNENEEQTKDSENDSKWLEDKEKDREDFPQGWHRKKQFVSKHGTVYHRGEEQEELFRTLEPDEYPSS